MSDRNVTLADLATNIKAFSTVNLLDKRHYKYTLEQLNKSKESGSIYKKRNVIKVRNLVPPPQPINMSRLIDKDANVPSREKSVYVIEQVEYEELYIGDSVKDEREKIDERIAKENAELEDEEQPTTKKI